MYYWSYQNGYLEAKNQRGTRVFTIPAESMWAPLADILNACPSLSSILLAGWVRI